MKYAIGDSLDMLLVSAQGQYKFATLFVVQPFDAASIFEAQDQ